MPTSAEDPDLDFRLDQHVRATIAPGFDVDAIERLLQCFPAEERDTFLEPFLLKPPMVIDAGGRAPDISILSNTSHPRLQSLLEDVWQPFGPPCPIDIWTMSRRHILGVPANAIGDETPANKV